VRSEKTGLRGEEARKKRQEAGGGRNCNYKF
jgi:hypothetical protein